MRESLKRGAVMKGLAYLWELRKAGDLNSTDIELYFYIWYSAGKDGLYWTSYSLLGEVLGISARTVNRSLARLQEGNLLQIPPKNGRRLWCIKIAKTKSDLNQDVTTPPMTPASKEQERPTTEPETKPQPLTPVSKVPHSHNQPMTSPMTSPMTPVSKVPSGSCCNAKGKSPLLEEENIKKKDRSDQRRKESHALDHETTQPPPPPSDASFSFCEGEKGTEKTQPPNDWDFYLKKWNVNIENIPAIKRKQWEMLSQIPPERFEPAKLEDAQTKKYSLSWLLSLFSFSSGHPVPKNEGVLKRTRGQTARYTPPPSLPSKKDCLPSTSVKELFSNVDTKELETTGQKKISSSDVATSSPTEEEKKETERKRAAQKAALIRSMGKGTNGNNGETEDGNDSPKGNGNNDTEDPTKQRGSGKSASGIGALRSQDGDSLRPFAEILGRLLLPETSEDLGGGPRTDE